MDENINVTTEVNDEMIEIVNEPVAQPEETKGLTGKQKAVGLGILGFAIYGIVELVIHGVRLVKKWIGKLKDKKAAKEEAKTGEVVDAEVVEIDNETMDKIQEK